MKLLQIFILTFSFIFQTYGQDFYVDKLTETNPEYPEDIYEFPILKGQNNEVIEKINSYLISEQLDIANGQEKTSIFESVWRTKDKPIASVGELTYKVELLNEKLYSVTISGEWCSAYCEGYEMTYNFDLKTGDLIRLDSLFNQNGQKVLLQEINSFKKETIRKKIDEIKIVLSKRDIDSDEQEYYQEMLELYQNCNTNHQSLEYFRFVPTDQNLKLIVGRCSAHYNRNVDELWEFNLELALTEWKNQFSEFGKEKLIN